MPKKRTSTARPAAKRVHKPERSAKAGANRAQPSKPASRSTSKSKDPLQRVRAICLALPETSEKISWGAPTFRVRDKIFAMFLDNHHGDGRIALWCNAPKGLQEVLVGTEPKRFFRPPYVGPRGWIGLHLLENSDAEVAGFVRESYCLTAPKRLRERVEG